MLEGAAFVATVRLVEVEGQVASLGVSMLVEEQDLTARQEEHPAWGIFLGEHPPDRMAPIAGAERVSRLAELLWERSHLQRVFGRPSLFEARIGQAEDGLADHQPRRVVAR